MSAVKRAACLSVFLVAAIVTVSLFAKQSFRTDSNSPKEGKSKQENVLDEDLARRDLGRFDELELFEVDAVLVKQAEAEVHRRLNYERKNNCSELKTFSKSGKVNFAAQNFTKGMQQILLEVKYGTEIFFARVSVITSGIKSSTHAKFNVKELVPGPCDTGFKNGLAVTVEGTLS